MVDYSIVLTVTQQEAERLKAWAEAQGFPTVEAYAANLLTNGLAAWEHEQNSQDFLANYTPVDPQ